VADQRRNIRLRDECVVDKALTANYNDGARELLEQHCHIDARRLK
jgi:hypothetical protein